MGTANPESPGPFSDKPERPSIPATIYEPERAEEAPLTPRDIAELIKGLPTREEPVPAV